MNIILILIQTYLIFNVIYLIVFAIASRFHKKVNKPNYTPDDPSTFAILIPAYKEDSVIIDTAKKALEQRYPADLFTVFVIADQLKASTLQKLAGLPIKVIKVVFEKSTKAKALNYAMTQIARHDHVIVLDADNVMEPDCLHLLNKNLNNETLVIQMQRVAKNLENHFEYFDGMSEGINNSIFRKGHVNLGLSCSLIGSGMAFQWELFKTSMADINALGGFDKALELTLLKRKIKIEYLEEAKVYDEKVGDGQSFVNQKTRWIAAQVKYGIQNFIEGLSQLARGNYDYFDKVVQFLLLPRLLLLGALSIGASLEFWINGSYWLLAGLIGMIASMFLAIPAQHIHRLSFGSLIKLPYLFFLMVYASLRYRLAQRNFLHTTHKVR